MTREEAIKRIENLIKSREDPRGKTELDFALDMAIEALKKPHGEWLSHYEYCKKHNCIPSGLIAFWWCNQCEQGVEIPTHFCPNCGALMRKEGEEE